MMKHLYNGKIHTINIIKANNIYEYVVDGEIINHFDVLALACKATNKEEAWKIMNVASRLFHPLDDPTFNTFYSAITTDLTFKFKNSSKK